MQRHLPAEAAYAQPQVITLSCLKALLPLIGSNARAKEAIRPHPLPAQKRRPAMPIVCGNPSGRGFGYA